MSRRETRTLSERYAEMAGELIATEPELAHIRRSEATICYLSSDHAKRSGGRRVLGECERVADRNKWAMPCDFTVTVYEPNCAGLSESQLRTLLFHELLHVGIGMGKDGQETYSVVPHDLQDFRAVVERYGTDWAEVRA